MTTKEFKNTHFVNLDITWKSLKKSAPLNKEDRIQSLIHSYKLFVDVCESKFRPYLMIGGRFMHSMLADKLPKPVHSIPQAREE